MIRTTLGALGTVPGIAAPSLLIEGNAVTGARAEEWPAPASRAEELGLPEVEESSLGLQRDTDKLAAR